MRLHTPKFEHPEEIYKAIIREHRENSTRMGEYLMACGWAIGDAAWAVVNWDLRMMAAAVAAERASRKLKLTMLSDAEIAQLRSEIEREKKTSAQFRPKKTTRIVRSTPRSTLRSPHKPKEPPA